MIEIVYEKEKQKPVGNEEFFRIPNNIRQIGEANEAHKIYIEDYAYTYLSRLSNENLQKGQAAILLGQTNWQDGKSYLFVKSAILLTNMPVDEDHLAFTEEIWKLVYEKNKEYFDGQEIIGWYLSIPGCSMELHEVICNTHFNHFGGNDKILLVMEPTEKEEAFYRYESGRLARQLGFYIYYEKNEAMQNYLIAENGNQSIEQDMVEDKAVKNFRKITQAKTEVRNQHKTISFMQAASAGMAIVIVAVGVIFMNDYKKLQGVGEAAEKIAIEETTKGLDSAKELDSAKQAETPVNGLANGEKESASDAEIGQIEHQVPEEMPKSVKEPIKEPVKAPESKPSPEPNKTEVTSTEGVVRSYTIQKGDTLSGISNAQYGTIGKIKEICDLNGLSAEQIIYAGQIILLP